MSMSSSSSAPLLNTYQQDGSDDSYEEAKKRLQETLKVFKAFTGGFSRSVRSNRLNPMSYKINMLVNSLDQLRKNRDNQSPTHTQYYSDILNGLAHALTMPTLQEVEEYAQTKTPNEAKTILLDPRRVPNDQDVAEYCSSKRLEQPSCDQEREAIKTKIRAEIEERNKLLLRTLMRKEIIKERCQKLYALADGNPQMSADGEKIIGRKFEPHHPSSTATALLYVVAGLIMMTASILAAKATMGASVALEAALYGTAGLGALGAGYGLFSKGYDAYRGARQIPQSELNSATAHIRESAPILARKWGA